MVSKVSCLYDVKGVGHALEGPWLMSLDASYHKEQYIWFRGGDLNVF